MRKSQQLLQLFLKYTPQTNHGITTELYHKAQFDKMIQSQRDPLFRYMQSLQVHKQYLQFFQIGVVRDQRSKIQKVAKYVGLAMPDVQMPSFLTPQSKENQKDSNPNQPNLSQNKNEEKESNK